MTAREMMTVRRCCMMRIARAGRRRCGSRSEGKNQKWGFCSVRIYRNPIHPSGQNSSYSRVISCLHTRPLSPTLSSRYRAHHTETFKVADRTADISAPSGISLCALETGDAPVAPFCIFGAEDISFGVGS